MATPASMIHDLRRDDSELPSEYARQVRYRAMRKTTGRKSSFDQKLKAHNIHTAAMVPEPGLLRHSLGTSGRAKLNS